MSIGWEAYAPSLAVDWIRSEPDRIHRQVSGGLLFLDVSGFTAMSERLASLGRVGSEEVTEVVGETFERLLVPAYDDGGSMLKFGGDALLVLFEGEGGGVRAARAAHAMMAILRAANPVQTRAGPVELGMTIGVHEGVVDLALVGETWRELVVLGPTLSEVIRVEGSAERDMVLVSPALARQLPADSVGGAVGSGVRLLAPPPAPTLRGLTPPKPHVAEARALVPDDVAQHLESGATEGEHRTATVAFLHFHGTDEIHEVEGGLAAAAAVHEVVRIVQRAAAPTGVCLLASDVDADGGKLILAAGVPRSREDDTDRLLRCLRTVIETPRALPIRIGVARGPVFAGPVGPPYRRTFTLLGDTVNLAARVMAKANEEEILGTAEMLNAARTLFDVEERDPFMAKGKSLPIRTLVVGGEIGIRLRMRPDEHTLVGRQEELSHLSRMVSNLGASHGAVACLTGPAGIGKSRLVDELQHHHPHVPFVLAACLETVFDRAFHGAAQVLRAMVGGDRAASNEEVLAAARALMPQLPTHYQGHLPLLGPVLQEELEETPETAALSPEFRLVATRALVGRLLRTAHPGPLVLVVEDTQWLDTESALLLSALVGTTLEELPWLVLVTARDELDLPDLPAPPSVRRDVLALTPLDPDHARELVLQDVERGLIGMDRVDDLVARAAGNPLFLTELVAAVAAGAEGSDQLEQVFRQRLDLLAGSDRRILGQAAVLGVEFPAELLAAIAGPDAVSPGQLRRLRDFLRPMRSGPLRFNQTIYQEVAYATIPFRRREELHAKAARAIQVGDPAMPDRDVLLSRHWFLAGEYDRAWPHTLAAAEHATARNAPGSAAALYRRALEAGQRGGRSDAEIGDVLERLGQALEIAGAYEDAADTFEQGWHLLGERDRAPVQIRLASVWEKLGEYDQSLRWLADMDVDDSRLLQRRDVERAAVLNRMGQFAHAREAALQAIDASEPSVKGRALWMLAWALDGLGDGGAVAVAAEATSVLEAAGDLAEAAKALITEGAARYFAGDWDAAVRAHQRASEYEQRVGDRVSAAISEMNIGEIRADQGRMKEAGRLLESAERVLSAAHHRAAGAFATLTLGRVAALRGDHEQAEHRLASALAVFLEVDAAEYAPQARARQAEAALFAGRHRAAIERCESILDEPADESLAPLVRRVAGCAFFHLGDLVDAGRLLVASRHDAVRAGRLYDRLLVDAAIADLLDGPPVDPDEIAGLGIVDLRLVVHGPQARSFVANGSAQR